jgi:hypothetical protein
MAAVSDKLTLARETSIRKQSDKPEVTRILEDLHYLVIAAFPTCYVQERKNGELIYVPEDLRHLTDDKNLMTVWRAGGKNMQIKPSDKEAYNHFARPDYLRRLVELYTGTLLPKAKAKDA